MSKIVKILRTSFLLFATLIVGISGTSIAQTTTPADNRSSIYGGYPYYDENDTLTNCNPVSGNFDVYVIGDSYSVGLEQNGFKDKLKEAGYGNVTINGVIGRSVSSGGGNGQPALQAVDTDSATIKSVGTVIIVLGTNPEADNYDSEIPELMKKINTYNPTARKFWVNVGHSASNVQSRIAPTNANIAKYATSNGYSVIDWNKVYKENPNYDGGLHPTDVGYDALGDLIVSSIGEAAASLGQAAPANNAADIVTDNKNALAAWQFFLSKGLTPVQAAGLLGNFQQESGINPESENSGSGAYGIAQWLGGRKERLLQKPNYNTLDVQLEFVWSELNGGYKTVLQNLKAAIDVRTATEVILKKYEIPCVGPTADECYAEEMSKRLPKAEKFLSEFGGITGASTPGCPGNSVTQAGVGGWEVEGTAGVMTFYSQYDPKWGNSPYGSCSISFGGCGPTSMAMVAATLTGDRTITPLITVDYFTSKGNSCGTNWSIWPDAAEKWGINYEDLGTDLSAAAKILNEGGLVIGSFGISSGNRTYFTSGRHLMVIRKVDESGNFYIADPLQRKADATKNTTGYTPSFLLSRSGLNGGALNHMWGFSR